MVLRYWQPNTSTQGHSLSMGTDLRHNAQFYKHKLTPYIYRLKLYVHVNPEATIRDE